MLRFELCFGSLAVGFGSGPGVFVRDMALALVIGACRGFLRLCDATGLSPVVTSLAPRFLPTRVWVCRFGFGIALCLWGLLPGMSSSIAEYV